jgi:ATP-dependent Clp protease ATP-binding subunit ClpA
VRYFYFGDRPPACPRVCGAGLGGLTDGCVVFGSTLGEVIDRFSDHCREALAAAEREARTLKHGQIGTEHVLLGLLRVEASVAARALRLIGVTHPKARRRILRLVDAGAESVENRISFTLRVREVLEDAFSGSVWTQRLGEVLVGPSFAPSSKTPWDTPVSPAAPRLSQGRVEVRTEDLLLALIAHGEGVAAHVLSQFGVDLEKAAVATQSIRFTKPATTFPLMYESEQWPPAPPKAN